MHYDDCTVDCDIQVKPGWLSSAFPSIPHISVSIAGRVSSLPVRSIIRSVYSVVVIVVIASDAVASIKTSSPSSAAFIAGKNSGENSGQLQLI